MNAIADNPVVDLSPDELGEDAHEMRVREKVALWAAIPIAVVSLIAATILEVAYHALILLWVLLGLPLTRRARAVAHVAATGGQAGAARLSASPSQSRGDSNQEVVLTFDELALIYKSLQAAKTLAALPLQDELLEDTIQVVDQSLSTFVH